MRSTVQQEQVLTTKTSVKTCKEAEKKIMGKAKPIIIKKQWTNTPSKFFFQFFFPKYSGEIGEIVVYNNYKRLIIERNIVKHVLSCISYYGFRILFQFIQ